MKGRINKNFVAGIKTAKKDTNSIKCSALIFYSILKQIEERSDIIIRRSTFDVGRSSKTNHENTKGRKHEIKISFSCF